MLPVIFITGHGGIPESVKAIKAGAIDFLEKPFLTEVLLQRIEEAVSEDHLIRSSIKKQNEIRSRISSLTEREKDVFLILTNSDELPSSKEIAKQLGISHRTVEHHRSRILEKTQTRSILELQGQRSCNAKLICASCNNTFQKNCLIQLKQVF